MINDVKLISAIVNNKDIGPALISSTLDEIFKGDNGDVWEFVKKYYYSHREVVPPTILQEQCPDFEIQETDGPVKYYIEQLHQEYKTHLIERIAKGIADNIDRVPTSNIINELNKMMSKLNKVSTVAKDLDITDTSKALEHYTQTKTLMEENGGVLGIRTGFDSIDANYSTGLYYGHYIYILSRTNMGKRIRIDEPIPTPNGWTTMGDLVIGDKVFGRDGKPCNVTAVSPIEANPLAYKIIFSDGAEIDADLDHQWLTTTYLERRQGKQPRIRTTKEILETLKHNGRLNHAIPINVAIDLPEQDLPIDPYVLGLWLGNEEESLLTLQIEDYESIEQQLTSRGYKHHQTSSQEDVETGSVSIWLESLNPALRQLNLLNNKHIPVQYLRSSIDQRIELFRGLMDAAGRIDSSSAMELAFTNKSLSFDSVELIRSLGIRSNCKKENTKLNAGIVSDIYGMKFVTTFAPFYVPRKLNNWIPGDQKRYSNRVIKDVIPTEPTPMRCITVDSFDHTYIAGKDWIVTHNSWFALQIAANAWRQHKKVLYISLEMSSIGVRDRAYTLLSEGKFGMSNLSRAEIELDELKDWSLEKFKKDNSFVVISTDELGDVNPSQIQAKIDQYAPDLVIVDYLQLLTDNRSSSGETERIRNVSKELKSIAMNNEIPLIAVVSASSNDTKEYHSPPEIYEVAGSRQSAYDTDLVLSLISHKQGDGSSRTEVVCRKNRHGPIFDFIVKMDINGGNIKEVWDDTNIGFEDNE